jgi:hypothetical protein
MTLLALLTLAFHPVWGQEDEPVQPEAEPLSVVWEFDAAPALVREALLKVLKDEEMALDPEGGEEGIVTVYVDFQSKHYGAENVAEPPPYLSENYQFLQPRKAVQGRLRLRARIEAPAKGTQVHVELDLLVRAFHSMARGGDAWAVRRSNGSIEAYLQQRLQAALEQGPGASEKKDP